MTLRKTTAVSNNAIVSFLVLNGEDLEMYLVKDAVHATYVQRVQ